MRTITIDRGLCPAASVALVHGQISRFGSVVWTIADRPVPSGVALGAPERHLRTPGLFGPCSSTYRWDVRSISLGRSLGTYYAPCTLADVLAAYPLPWTRTASIRRLKVTVMQQGLLDQLRGGAGYRLLVAPAQMNSCLHDSGSNRRALAYRTVVSFLFLQHPQSCYT